jgi:ATP-dependent DNA ligase
MAFQPMPLSRRPAPFDHFDWLFELKYDGFRSLAYVDYRGCRLVSRNGHVFASFSDLASWIAQSLEGTTAVFDGEIVCVDQKGRPRFNDLLFRCGAAAFSLSTCSIWMARISAKINSPIVRRSCARSSMRDLTIHGYTLPIT